VGGRKDQGTGEPAAVSAVPRARPFFSQGEKLPPRSIAARLFERKGVADLHRPRRRAKQAVPRSEAASDARHQAVFEDDHGGTWVKLSAQVERPFSRPVVALVGRPAFLGRRPGILESMADQSQAVCLEEGNRRLNSAGAALKWAGPDVRGDDPGSPGLIGLGTCPVRRAVGLVGRKTALPGEVWPSSRNGLATAEFSPVF